MILNEGSRNGRIILDDLAGCSHVCPEKRKAEAEMGGMQPGAPEAGRGEAWIVDGAQPEVTSS